MRNLMLEKQSNQRPIYLLVEKNLFRITYCTTEHYQNSIYKLKHIYIYISMFD